MQAELIKGSNGIYEVAVDGHVVASKGLLGFPTDDAVTKAVQEALKPGA